MQQKENALALVSKEDLSLVQENTLNEQQLQQILKRTPTKFVKKRPAKGGGTWDYVSGGYVKKCLNIMFGWDWDFEIMDQQIMHGEAIVKGRLTCRTAGRTIIKMQFGNKDIVYKKQSPEEAQKGLERIPLSIGNDLKSAATDALKKCAAEIGIAADIYNKEDFKEVQIASEEDIETVLAKLYKEKKDSLPPDEQINLERIIVNKETKSYKKAIRILTELK